ncbi:16S rRNA (guanine(527)-N(7))-methyltransferase RsmG [Acholeplasma sp. OttesenSCG-928-E16]|nr:16S rRNA (guanine(527)-N(7))-methyltransferase RsmG [Acholeplasma sp. OttesenSCG-928-E16]
MNFQNKVFEELGITLSEKQIKLFEDYFDFLIMSNKVTNLTRIVEKEEVYYKHFFDSLTVTKIVDFNKTINLADLGSGAGFPGIPLKIAFPHLKITLIDSLGKRTSFLKKLVDHLNLDHIEIINARAEEYAKTAINKFDLVIARAFSKIQIFLELAFPIAKEKGYLLAMKGNNYTEELKKSQQIREKTKLLVVKTEKLDLPFGYGERTNILFQKTKHVAGYPRRYSVILKEATSNCDI